MAEYKVLLGYVSIVIAFVGYVIYFRQIFSGQTKPHAFSWFAWGITTGIIFAAQIVKQGGAGAWMTGFTFLACFAIAGTAIFKGSRDFVKLDWIFLSAALIALLIWYFAKDPTLSVVFLTITDATAILPTVRKAYSKPQEESITLFSLNSLKATVSLFALQSYSLATWLYPAMLVLVNPVVVLVLFVRRKRLQKGEQSITI